MANFEKIRVDELLPEQLRETAKNLIDFLKIFDKLLIGFKHFHLIL